MAKAKLVRANETIAEGVAKGFQKMTDAVAGGYKKIESGAVGGYEKMEDRFVDRFLTKEGESVADAKARLKREQEERRGR